MSDAPTLPPKDAADSRMSLAVITQPSDANVYGTLHGGVILRLADECAHCRVAACRRRPDRRRRSTRSCSSDLFIPASASNPWPRSLMSGGRQSECHIEVYAEPLEPPAERPRWATVMAFTSPSIPTVVLGRSLRSNTATTKRRCEASGAAGEAEGNVNKNRSTDEHGLKIKRKNEERRV